MVRTTNHPLRWISKALLRSGQFHEIVQAADRARDSRKFEEAATLYKSALLLNPRTADIWVQLGNMLKDSDRYLESEDAYNEALKIRPDHSDTFLQLGHLMNRSGRSRDAIGFYERAVEADQTNSQAFKALAVAAGNSEILRNIPGSISINEFIELEELVGMLRSSRCEYYSIFQHSAFRKSSRKT